MLLLKSICAYREIFNGDRWLNDPRFFSPMVQSTCGNVYLHDFVMFHKANGCRQGHVNKFFSKVSKLLFQCVYL